MVRLPIIAAALILPGLALAQPTDDAAKCQAAAGSYLTGTVVSGPRFKPGAPHGTYLLHTHLTLRGDTDGPAYDVAIDNVFANEYRHNLAWIKSQDARNSSWAFCCFGVVPLVSQRRSAKFSLVPKSGAAIGNHKKMPSVNHLTLLGCSLSYFLSRERWRTEWSAE